MSTTSHLDRSVDRPGAQEGDKRQSPDRLARPDKKIRAAASASAEKANPDGPLGESYVLRLDLDELSVDDLGRLTEVPDALKLLANVRHAIDRELSPGIHLGASKICLGSYQVDIRFLCGWQMELIETTAEMWISSLEEDCLRLKTNAMNTRPYTATELGLSEKRVATLKSLGELGAKGYSLVLARVDNGKELIVPMPTLAEVLALPKRLGELRKFAGEITGLGATQANGARIEVGFRAMAWAAELSLDEAFRLLVAKATVSGLVDDSDGLSVLTSYQFSMPNGDLFSDHCSDR